MRRRDFITLLGSGAAAWPLAARAQQASGMKRVGVLMGVDEPEFRRWYPAFRDALAKLGWEEPHNIRIDSRWGIDPRRARAYGRELVVLAPDVILASPGPAVEALPLTLTIPVVFTTNTDPVEAGYVQTFAHPGGNMTGFTQIEQTVTGKWLQLIVDIAPGLKHVGILRAANLARSRRDFAWIAAAAALMGVITMEVLVRDDVADIERAIETFAREPNSGLIVTATNFFPSQSAAIVRSVERHRLPAIYYNRLFVDAGGLMSYGVDEPDIFRRAAGYIDRILRGEKPGDLPVQHPTKFELVVNLKTAKMLGLNLSSEFLLLADEVIE